MRTNFLRGPTAMPWTYEKLFGAVSLLGRRIWLGLRWLADNLKKTVKRLYTSPHLSTFSQSWFNYRTTWSAIDVLAILPAREFFTLFQSLTEHVQIIRGCQSLKESSFCAACIRNWLILMIKIILTQRKQYAMYNLKSKDLRSIHNGCKLDPYVSALVLAHVILSVPR